MLHVVWGHGMMKQAKYDSTDMVKLKFSILHRSQNVVEENQ